MASENWDSCLAIILREEGGNDDDPDDPGGRTSRGITQREYNIYRRSHPSDPSDVWAAPQSAVNDIYKTQYWNPYCDSFPKGIDLVFFNTSVNSGRQQAVKELQRALKVADDGMVGMETMDAVTQPQDYQALIRNMCDQRRAYYKRLKTFWKYGKGWLARTDRVEAAAINMAPAFVPSATPSAVPQFTETVSAKADPDDVKQPVISPKQGASGAGIATFLSGVTGQLQDLSDKLSPLKDTMKLAQVGCIVIAIICAGLTIYAIYHHQKNEAVT